MKTHLLLYECPSRRRRQVFRSSIVIIASSFRATWRLSLMMAFFGLIGLSAVDFVVKPVFLLAALALTAPVCPPNSWYGDLARRRVWLNCRQSCACGAAANAESLAFFCFIKLPSKSSSSMSRTSSPASPSAAAEAISTVSLTARLLSST